MVDAVSLLSLPSAKAHISSTAIRTALGEGQVAEAASMLGRLYAIEGEVVVGDKRGRTIGFPHGQHTHVAAAGLSTRRRLCRLVH